MNTTKNNTTFPQTVEIPKPLEIHSSVSPLAAKLLLAVAEVLALEPKRYAQQHPSPGWSKCGTACCILGHMNIISGHAESALWPSKFELTSSQYERIFSSERWPASVWDERGPMQMSAIPASIAIARIEHFLRTGE